MNTAGEGRQHLDTISVLTAKRTLLQLLERAGVHSADAEELIGLVEAGVLALAHHEIAGVAASLAAAPPDGTSGPEGAGDGSGPRAEPRGGGEDEDGSYAAGRRDGARAVADALGALADRALREAVGAGAGEGPADDERPPVGRMELERAKVAVLPHYLTFTELSDLDPEVSEQVLTAVLGTMGPRQRAAYAGRLAGYVEDHRAELERLFAAYGPGSPIAIHGRYSLLHSPASVAVMERLATVPAALRKEWDAAELPPAWLDGLTTAGAPGARG
ncbi:hypothetical protein GCM10022244_57380 [Streptomyces gulbargensis]|uniref:Uncharacterized protein n=1 Tax=Streptomyces gulbargensis TaxID=364901 RepID=A0ABP7NBC6_9ACTN